MKKSRKKNWEKEVHLLLGKYPESKKMFSIKTHEVIGVLRGKKDWIYRCPYCENWDLNLLYHCHKNHLDKTDEDVIRDLWQYDEYPLCCKCGKEIPKRALNQMHPRKYGKFVCNHCQSFLRSNLGVHHFQKKYRPIGKDGEDVYTVKGVKTRIKVYGTNSHWVGKHHSKYGFDSSYEDQFWERQMAWSVHCERMTEVVPYHSLSKKKFRVYQPDFIFRTFKINGKPLVVEVKSEYIYKRDPDVLTKLTSAISKGYSLILVDPSIERFFPKSLEDCKRIFKEQQKNFQEIGCFIPEYL